MIILSGVLVVLAIALLVTGIVTGNTGHEVAGLDGLKLIYVSIGVSIISALCLAIGVFLRRKELFGTAESGATAKRSTASRSGKTARPAKAKARVGAGDESPAAPAASATALDVPAETTVFVVPGRKRYHLETCRQLAGRDKEELTFVEAREEGFTACTACLPDTALAARAALSETEPADKPADDDARPTETLESAADTADLRSLDEDPAQVTRTDLPVTRLEPDTIEPDPAEIEPAAESPAAAELRDVPQPSPSAQTEEATTGTAPYDEATEAPEATERPSEARSRSFFEPLKRSDAAPAEDAATTPADSTPAESTTADSTPAESTTADSTTAESTTAESTMADSTTADSTMAESTTAGPAAAGTTDTTDEDASDEAAPGSPEPSEPQDAPAMDLHDAEPVSEEPAVEVPAAEEPADLKEPEPESDEPAGETAETEEAPEADEEPEPVKADAADSATVAEADTVAEATDAEANDGDADEAEADDAGDPADAANLSFVRILSGTKRYHRPDCALIEDIAEDADDLETLSPAEAKERGCTPCLVCQPDKDLSADEY